MKRELEGRPTQHIIRKVLERDSPNLACRPRQELTDRLQRTLYDILGVDTTDADRPPLPGPLIQLLREVESKKKLVCAVLEENEDLAQARRAVITSYLKRFRCLFQDAGLDKHFSDEKVKEITGRLGDYRKGALDDLCSDSPPPVADEEQCADEVQLVPLNDDKEMAAPAGGLVDASSDDGDSSSTSS